MRSVAFALISILAWTAPSVARAQSADATKEVAHLSNLFGEVSASQMQTGITYRTVNGWEGKLDVYQPHGQKGPNPTVVTLHGGAYVGGDRTGLVFALLPWLQMGWTVVNVDYRLSGTALAPAAVEDSRCALRWIYRNAKQYNIDTTKLVLTGWSVGSHLAMITGMLPPGTPLDAACPGDRPGGAAGLGPVNNEELKVAAIVDWYGPSDLKDLLAGPNLQSYAVAWFGSEPNRDEIAKLVSPINYVRPGIPPIFTVAGEADARVPYTQKVRLHAALEKAHVPHELFTVPKGKHGILTDDQSDHLWGLIRTFLNKQNLPTFTSDEISRLSNPP